MYNAPLFCNLAIMDVRVTGNNGTKNVQVENWGID
jgi:hypothetical protein